jgi:hypothetical protein
MLAGELTSFDAFHKQDGCRDFAREISQAPP